MLRLVCVIPLFMLFLPTIMSCSNQAAQGANQAREQVKLGSFVCLHQGSGKGLTRYGLASIPLGGLLEAETREYIKAWNQEITNYVQALGEDSPELSELELGQIFASLAANGNLQRIKRDVPLGNYWKLDEENKIKWVEGYFSYYILVFRNREAGERYHWWCASRSHPFPYETWAYYDKDKDTLYVAIRKIWGGEKYYCQAVQFKKSREIGHVLLTKAVIETSRGTAPDKE